MLSTNLLNYYRQLSQQLLTVVDLETTGLYPSDSRVIEISVLQATLEGGIQSQETTLINPQTRIPSKITQITGISQEMVERDGAIASNVFPHYLPLLNSGTLTAHNIEFDYPFLQAEYQRLGIIFERPVEQHLCTVQLSRLMLPDLPSRSLPNLVRHFGFQVSASHRAEADTLACWLLAKQLLTEILNEPDEAVLLRFAKQWLPLREAAKMLNCSQPKAKAMLAIVPSRQAGRSGTLMYQRGDVERVLDEEPGESQLSLL